MTRKLLASLACIALVSCKPAQPQTDWHGFVQRTVERYFELNPDFAVSQGDHFYDGRLPDWSEAGLKAQADVLHKVIRDADAFTDLDEADAFERVYLVREMKGELFFLEDTDDPHRNPSYYIGTLDPNVYISRDYADGPTRMKALTAFFNQVPQAAKEIRANLKMPMPATYFKLGIAGFGGLADYYENDAPQAFADVDAPEVQQRFKVASAKAAKAMRGLADWLKSEQPNATQDFALGPEKFSKMLKATEDVDIPLDRLMQIARENLAKDQAAAKMECARYAPGLSVKQCLAKVNDDKPQDGPVAAAARQVPELTAFVKQHDVVSIPGKEQALVRESPPYHRQNIAYMNPPGPLEQEPASTYYISPPDPAWSPKVQRDYLPGKDVLLFFTVHEVMPGHYLQFLHSNRSKSLVGRLFVGYGFAEGWAHYAEQMMWDAGLGDGDPEVHLGQLHEAFERDCRFISAIGLHTQAMTVEQSKELFMNQCYLDEGAAEQQAARGTYDPQYLNYTLNKLMITKLRDDWTASRGGRKAWKAFHDKFLSYGGPPVPLVRQAMLDESEPSTGL